jgi:hypothetical protein
MRITSQIIEGQIMSTIKQWKQQRAKDRREARGRETQSLMQVKCRNARKGLHIEVEKESTLERETSSPLYATPKEKKRMEV